MTKVSVLVPIYNVEKYLNQCLDSLCSQTLEDMEIICINDGSTDSCGKILEYYQKKDSRIKIITKANSGYGNSMNIGLDNASGEYIGIVESDDFIDSNMMEKLYNIAKGEPDFCNGLDIVKSNCYFYSKNGSVEKNEYNDAFEELPLNKVIEPVCYSSLFLKLQTIWSALYKRTFLLENNIRFNETPGASYQDVSFVFQTYACAKTIKLIPDAYLHYRIDNVGSSVNSPNKVFCICDEIDYINSFIENRGIDVINLKGIASRLGFRVLKENYENLASAYQYALYLKMVEYFREYKEKHYIDNPLWDSEAKEQLHRCLANPNKYFLDTCKSFEDNRMKMNICRNQAIYIQSILDTIKNSSDIMIYGAGIIGNDLLHYLLLQGINKNNIHFIVSNVLDNPNTVEGIEVVQVDKVCEQKKNNIVVVAVREQLQYEIVQDLVRRDFTNIVVIDMEIRKRLLEYK